MLFLVNSAGVPSEASFLRLFPTGTPPPSAPAPAAAAGPRSRSGAEPGAIPGPNPEGGTPAARRHGDPPAHGTPRGDGARRPRPRGGARPGSARAARPTGGEGFENPMRGIPEAARVRVANSGRRGLRVGAGAVVPGPALQAGTYRASLRVRSGGVRLSATAAGRTITLTLTATPGRRRWRGVTDAVRLGTAGPVRVRLRVVRGGAIVNDLVLSRRR